MGPVGLLGSGSDMAVIITCGMHLFNHSSVGIIPPLQPSPDPDPEPVSFFPCPSHMTRHMARQRYSNRSGLILSNLKAVLGSASLDRIPALFDLQLDS